MPSHVLNQLLGVVLPLVLRLGEYYLTSDLSFGHYLGDLRQWSEVCWKVNKGLIMAMTCELHIVKEEIWLMRWVELKLYPWDSTVARHAIPYVEWPCVGKHDQVWSTQWRKQSVRSDGILRTTQYRLNYCAMNIITYKIAFRQYSLKQNFD